MTDSSDTPAAAADPAPDPDRPATEASSERESRRLQAALARAGIALGARLPQGLARALGGLAGTLGYALPGRTRSVTRTNLSLCLPELTPSDRTRIGRRSVVSAARLASELGGIWHAPRERVLERVTAVEGAEAVDEGLRAGRGVVLVTPHLGSWELAGLYVSARWPMTTIYKPPRIRELEDYYSARRGRFGARLVPAGPSGVGALVRALRRGEVVGVLPDQDPGRGSGVFVPFFGVPAKTSVLVPRLVQRTGAAAVITACLRRPGKQGFLVRFEPLSPALAAPDVEAATAALNADVERFVRRFPEQYLWSYKRFRARPDGKPNPYN